MRIRIRDAKSFWPGIRDGKIGSGINILDPQQWWDRDWEKERYAIPGTFNIFSLSYNLMIWISCCVLTGRLLPSRCPFCWSVPRSGARPTFRRCGASSSQTFSRCVTRSVSDSDPAFRLNTDPAPHPDLFWIEGFWWKKIKKLFTGEKNCHVYFFDQKLQFTCP